MSYKDYERDPRGFMKDSQMVGSEVLFDIDEKNKLVKAEHAAILGPAFELMRQIVKKDKFGNYLPDKDANKELKKLQDIENLLASHVPTSYVKNFKENVEYRIKAEFEKKLVEQRKINAEKQIQDQELMKLEAIVYLVSHGKSPADFDLLNPVPAANKLAVEVEARRLTPENENFNVDNWYAGCYHTFKEPNVYPKQKPPEIL